MPSKTDALDFVINEKTSRDQLRRACDILELDCNGTSEELRSRLLDAIHRLDERNPVVCLNPRVPPRKE
jgi:hypothetical protein